MQADYLPISQGDLKKRGWDVLDIFLITGDAYVDHPSYGAAVIGKVLEDAPGIDTARKPQEHPDAPGSAQDPE